MLFFVAGSVFPVCPVFVRRCIAVPQHPPKISAASNIQREYDTNLYQVFQNNRRQL